MTRGLSKEAGFVYGDWCTQVPRSSKNRRAEEVRDTTPS